MQVQSWCVSSDVKSSLYEGNLEVGSDWSPLVHALGDRRVAVLSSLQA